MKFRARPVEVEAIAFDDLVKYGLLHAQTVVNGMPWSFGYNGYQVTHENDNAYLIPTAHQGVVRFNRGELLITDENGELRTCRAEIFVKMYERIPETT